MYLVQRAEQTDVYRRPREVKSLGPLGQFDDHPATLSELGAGIHEDDAVVLAASGRFMDVPEDVKLRFHLEHAVEQVATATKITHAVLIENPRRWSVRNEHIDTDGNLRPHLRKLLATRQVERPSAEVRLPRTAVEADAVDLATGVFKVDRVRDAGTSFTRPLLKAEVVIPANDDLVFVRQRSEPAVERFDIFETAATGDVATVNEHIAVGNDGEMMPCVRVGNANDSHMATY